MRAMVSTDALVEEYLIYRGFTQTYRTFHAESKSDRSKSFEVAKIVDQIFQDLNSFNIEHFVAMWSFLNQRFFLHLDQEYTTLSEEIKA